MSFSYLKENVVELVHAFAWRGGVVGCFFQMRMCSSNGHVYSWRKSGRTMREELAVVHSFRVSVDSVLGPSIAAVHDEDMP